MVAPGVAVGGEVGVADKVGVAIVVSVAVAIAVVGLGVIGADGDGIAGLADG